MANPRVTVERNENELEAGGNEEESELSPAEGARAMVEAMQSEEDLPDVLTDIAALDSSIASLELRLLLLKAGAGSALAAVLTRHLAPPTLLPDAGPTSSSAAGEEKRAADSNAAGAADWLRSPARSIALTVPASKLSCDLVCKALNAIGSLAMNPVVAAALVASYPSLVPAALAVLCWDDKLYAQMDSAFALGWFLAVPSARRFLVSSGLLPRLVSLLRPHLTSLELRKRVTDTQDSLRTYCLVAMQKICAAAASDRSPPVAAAGAAAGSDCTVDRLLESDAAAVVLLARLAAAGYGQAFTVLLLSLHALGALTSLACLSPHAALRSALVKADVAAVATTIAEREEKANARAPAAAAVAAASAAAAKGVSKAAEGEDEREEDGDGDAAAVRAQRQAQSRELCDVARNIVKLLASAPPAAASERAAPGSASLPPPPAVNSTR